MTIISILVIVAGFILFFRWMERISTKSSYESKDNYFRLFSFFIVYFLFYTFVEI